LNRSEAQNGFVPGQVAPFVCGIACAVTFFLLLFRFEMAGLAPVVAPGLALGVAVAGLSAGRWTSGGISGASRLRNALAGLAALVLLSVLAVVWGNDWLLDAAAGLLGFGALAALAGRRAASRSIPLLTGVLTGMIACAAGLVGFMSLPGIVIPAVALAAVMSAVTARGQSVETREDGAWSVSPALLVAAALGAAGAALVRNYLPITGSLAYAGMELGAGFVLGLLVRAHALRKQSARPSALLLGAAGVAVLACVNALSFVLYPDLVGSGSAAYQTPPHLLTAGRVFPFWLIAFGFGVFSAPVWSARGTLLAAAAGAAAAGLLGTSYLWPSVAVVVLCLCCCGAVVARVGEGTRVFRLGTVGLVVASLMALLLLEPHGDWLGVRTTIKGLEGREKPTGEMRRWSGAFGADGLHVRLGTGGESGQVRNGQVLEAAGDVRGVVRLGVGLGLACAGGERPIAVIGPPLADTTKGLEILNPRNPPDVLTYGDFPTERTYGLIVCGPGALSSLRNPLVLLAREQLEILQSRLSAGGTFVLWLPLGCMSEQTLLQTLSTVDLTFGGYDVHLRGSEAVVVAGRHRPHFARLRAQFADPGKRAWMRDGGYWEPVELLADFAAEAQDLRPVTELARTFSIVWPERPPRLGRDLSAPRNPVAPASILQNRLMGPERLLRRVTFQGDKQQYVALRGFTTYYRAMTQRLLERLAGEDEMRQTQLVRFLQGPHARLDLMAPQADTRLMQLADAMFTFGMPKRSIDLLQDAVDSGREDFVLRSRLGKALAAASRYKEALEHYRRALELRPGSVDTMRHIAALLLKTGSFGEGARMLRRVIEEGPDNTIDLLMLAALDARMGNMAEAEGLARRVLRLEPNNPDAQAILQLARQGTTRSGGSDVPECPDSHVSPRGER